MKSFWRITRYIFPYRLHLGVASFFMMLFVIFNMAAVVLVIPLINVLFTAVPATATPIPDPVTLDNFKEAALAYMNNWINSMPRLDALRYICLLILGSFFFKNFFRYLQTYVMATAEQGIIRDLRQDLYEHLHRLSLSYFTEARKGTLMSRITNDVRIVNDTVIAVINSLFRDPPQILFYLAFLFIVNWQLTLIVILVIPLTGLMLARIADYLKRESTRLQETMADLTAILDETLAGMRIVKAFCMEKFEINKFKAFNERYYRTFVRIVRRRELSSPLTEFISVLVVVVILWFMGSLIFSGNSGIPPGVFVAYIFAMLQMLQPMKFFGQMFGSLGEGMAGAKRVFDLLDIQPRIMDAPDAIELDAFRDRIEFHDVAFKYDTSGYVLRDINMVINVGEVVAIVGPSGAGKSTLVDLIPRFYDVVKGSITIDGIDVRRIRIESLRGKMGIVTQETILFNDTVRNNIAYGITDISQEELERAARAANAHDFITAFPKGYDTVIGDRGVKISGGERQRISIARAILKNPPILILDEATSSLDTESEQLVQEAIENLMQGRTSVVIAHRLSTIRRADRIYVLDGGRIVETGRHEELMKKTDGLYKRLHDMQFART
ncbi:MAG: ABC transporter ATP-binding protein [Chlorobi bacterium]|nr:ABC transporter ATP-binding protein [Chlorobiota bacterium]